MSVYLFRNGVICLILIHIDNGMVGCNNNVWFDNFVKSMHQFFVIELHDSDTLLGLRILRPSWNTFHLTQELYIDNLHEEYKLQNDTKIVHIRIAVDLNKRFPIEAMKEKNGNKLDKIFLFAG